MQKPGNESEGSRDTYVLLLFELTQRRINSIIPINFATIRQISIKIASWK